MNQSTCRWIMVVHIKGFKGLMEGIIKRQEDMVGAMGIREQKLNPQETLRTLARKNADEDDCGLIVRSQDIHGVNAENKRSDEEAILFDRIKTCNVETVDYKDASALIRKTAHINQKTVKVLVDGESSVNLFDPESQRKPWVCVIYTKIDIKTKLETFDGSSQNEDVRRTDKNGTKARCDSMQTIALRIPAHHRLKNK
ncbi:unnamed protein product [Albugo candida]|uniref:Uncharacterized protein n=1 Tax=Albugo candida TaxID=65357 RepID=A0A024G1J8_9STRA|nr:unnamed protein product [Albugo candida]|eukprot:CCI40396.1 unnamed protein product [Albugo candida]